MSRDYSTEGDPYGISEYTAQSADQNIDSKREWVGEIRGNTEMVRRSLPTQAEADAIKGVSWQR